MLSSRCRRWVAAVALLYCLGLIGIEVGPGPRRLARLGPGHDATATAATEGGGRGGECERGGARVDERRVVPALDVPRLGADRGRDRRDVVLPDRAGRLDGVPVPQGGRRPRDLVREVSDLLGQKQYTEAYQRLAADRSFLARVLAAGVRKLPSGLAHAQRAMEMANDDVTMEMEHRTTYLATVGTLGPMIGLVGTVYGMILSFRVIATAGASPQASQLAAGISTALFATLEGIAISIPAIYFYALFRNRIARLSLEVALAAESLLEQFSPGVRAPHPLAAAVAVRLPDGAIGRLASGRFEAEGTTGRDRGQWDRGSIRD